jgi:hypothetical protein
VGGGECLHDAHRPTPVHDEQQPWRECKHLGRHHAITFHPIGHIASTRAHVTSAAAILEVDDVATPTTHKDFTAHAPAQPTCLTRVEHRNDMAQDADIVMHDWAVGMARGRGQDMLYPTETHDLRIRARHHGT